jgi:hypothetical protein
VAEAVVDLLEAVQADGGDREALAGAARVAITMRMRSDSSRRFGSSVSASWVAMWRRRCSVARWADMSRPTASSSVT